LKENQGVFLNVGKYSNEQFMNDKKELNRENTITFIENLNK
jgi:hypothetical protein